MPCKIDAMYFVCFSGGWCGWVEVDGNRWIVEQDSPGLILIFSCTDPTWEVECEYFDHDQQVWYHYMVPRYASLETEWVSADHKWKIFTHLMTAIKILWRLFFMVRRCFKREETIIVWPSFENCLQRFKDAGVPCSMSDVHVSVRKVFLTVLKGSVCQILA